MMNMRTFWKQVRGLLAMLGILSLGLAPVPVMADASNPRYVPHHAKAKAKPHTVRRAAARPAAAAAPQPAAPVEAAQPAPAPAPVVETPPAPVVAGAPAPAPAAAKLSVTKKGGGTVIALLAAAGVIGGIALATSGSSVSR
jgi:hypothetical protein